MLRWFASSQIRNVACLGGNLVTASPISDMNPMLACMGANLVLASVDSEGEVTRRRVAVSDFFLRYRIVDLQPTELVESIEIPIIQQSLEYISPFKQARRREDDISIVNSGMRAVIAPDPSGSGSYIIKDASMAFGGMAPTTVMTPKTAQALVGQALNADTFRSAAQVLMDELYLPEAVPGGQVEYRRALASSYLYQFYLYIVSELELDIKSSVTALPPAPPVSDDERSGAESFLCSAKPSVGGVQKYPAPKVAIGLEGGGRSARNPPTETITKAASDKDAVGKASHHASGPLHCTGEALYVDDIPLPPATLHAQLVLATKCNVELKSIDASPALSIPGVVAVYTHKDLEKLGGSNILGPIKKDEVCFLPVGEKAVFVGQVIGICVAESFDAAELGAKNVATEYEEATDEPIVTIEQVSYYARLYVTIFFFSRFLGSRTHERPVCPATALTLRLLRQTVITTLPRRLLSVVLSMMSLAREPTQVRVESSLPSRARSVMAVKSTSTWRLMRRWLSHPNRRQTLLSTLLHKHPQRLRTIARLRRTPLRPR